MYKRGEVYLVQENNPVGSEIKKTRPWAIVSIDIINKARSSIIGVPLSTQAKEIPDLSIRVILNGVGSCAVLDQIRALDKSRFIRLEGNLTKYELENIESGLKKILGL